MDEGPLQLRRSPLAELQGIVPAPGELVLPNDPANEGALRVGTTEGVAGGVQVGLGPLERELIRATPQIKLGGDAICLASARNWQSQDTTKSGWNIPPDGLIELHHPVLAGHVPGRTLTDGGYVEIFLHGYMRLSAIPQVETRLMVRLDLNGVYAGPDWGSGTKLGWGWWSFGSSDSDADALKALTPNEHFDWMFHLCIHSLGARDGVETADGTQRNLMLRGEIEARTGEVKPYYNEAQLLASGNPIYRKPIFQYVTGSSNPNPRRDMEIKISVAGGQRSAGGTGDEVHVHGGDMMLFAPRLGYSFGDHSLADPLV